MLNSLRSLSVVQFNDNVCLNQSASTPSAIADLSKNIALKCPSIIEMIEVIIVNGEDFQSLKPREVELEKIKMKSNGLRTKIQS